MFSHLGPLRLASMSAKNSALIPTHTPTVIKMKTTRMRAMAWALARSTTKAEARNSPCFLILGRRAPPIRRPKTLPLFATPRTYGNKNNDNKHEGDGTHVYEVVNKKLIPGTYPIFPSRATGYCPSRTQFGTGRHYGQGEVSNFSPPPVDAKKRQAAVSCGVRDDSDFIVKARNLPCVTPSLATTRLKL